MSSAYPFNYSRPDARPLDKTQQRPPTLLDPVLCSNLAVGNVAMIDDRPCKLTIITKLGKQYHLVGQDIFSGVQRNVLTQADSPIQVPNLHYYEWWLFEILNDRLYLNMGDECLDDVKLPEGKVGAAIKSAKEAGKRMAVEVCTWQGEQRVARYRLEDQPYPK